MRITYIHHSGFLVETGNSYYIFDYYDGELPGLDRSKETVVFCSHFHGDHFNPEIFKLLEEAGISYQAVLAEDIEEEKYPNGIRVTKAESGKTYELDNRTQVRTLRSTDSGVAYIVRTGEGTIYHAGDLNDWYWEGEPEEDNAEMTAKYRTEIDKIRGQRFEAAFVPLDPRQEGHYADGMLYFLQNTDCGAVYPMHFWDTPGIIDTFCSEFPEYSSRIKNTNSTEGEEI